MKKLKIAILLMVALVVGVLLGGYLFADTRPRSILALNKCAGTCFQANELLGLVTSVGVQKFGVLAPSVIKETDKTVAIKHPSPNARIHYLKNMGEMSDEDGEYLIDAFKVAREIIKDDNLTAYRLTTNGQVFKV